VGTKPDVAEFCREIETYLCRKNDGHLIRVTGPSFDLVSGWAERGVPIRVAFAGIDRYFERYYRQGPRRRPVRIDFCEADVLDVFDEWRRATGVTQSAVASRQSSVDSQQSSVESQQSSVESQQSSKASLPAHLQRVVMRLTSARSSGSVGPTFDALIDRVADELESARNDARGVRGERRRQLVERLAAIDRELLLEARAATDENALDALRREADTELAPFKGGMTADAFARAREAAIDRLVRERYRLPTIAFG
jgi:hypothetical protein